MGHCNPGLYLGNIDSMLQYGKILKFETWPERAEASYYSARLYRLAREGVIASI